MPEVASPDGTRLHVEVEGDGEPVTVFAHGLTNSCMELAAFTPMAPGTKVRFCFRGHAHSGTPEPGHYRVYSKSRWTTSTVSAETMQYMVRFTHGENTGTPIGFHSIPRDYNGHPAQSVADLGKPLSHGCIRQRLRDAAFLWKFAHVGTKVVVTH